MYFVYCCSLFVVMVSDTEEEETELELFVLKGGKCVVIEGVGNAPIGSREFYYVIPTNTNTNTILTYS